MALVQRLRDLHQRHGVVGLVRRAGVRSGERARDAYRRIFLHRHIVFRLDPPPAPGRDVPGLVIHRHASEGDVQPELLRLLVDLRGPAFLDMMRLEFDHRAVMWIGLLDGEFAAILFTRRGRYFKGWFVPIGPDDIVIFAMGTEAQFRGRGLSPAMMRHAINTELASTPGAKAWIDCAVWNAPSIRAIQKTGFQRVGVMKPIGADIALFDTPPPP